MCRWLPFLDDGALVLLPVGPLGFGVVGMIELRCGVGRHEGTFGEVVELYFFGTLVLV